MNASAPSSAALSRTRTVVLVLMLVVWITEATSSSVRPWSESVTRAFGFANPDDPQLALALYIAHTLEGAAKAALAVLALFALRSRIPFVRSALFVPMALVPPLNLALSFRVGVQPRAALIAATLSLVLWGTFFLYKEGDGQTQAPVSAAETRRIALDDAWFGLNALVMTFAAALFVATPVSALRLVIPCLSEALHGTRPAGMDMAALSAGSHFTAVATATGIAAFAGRRYRTVRNAVGLGSTLEAALLCGVPLTRIASDTGRACATSSLLVIAVPMFIGWLTYYALRINPWLHQHSNRKSTTSSPRSESPSAAFPATRAITRRET